MFEWLDIAQLRLSADKPLGYVPRPSARLLDRVREHGPVQPVVVRQSKDGGYDILANAETWVAAGRVGLHQVPVVIREDLTEAEAAEIVESHYSPEGPNAIDEARHFEEQLVAFGGRSKHGSITKLAAVTGRARPYIAHALRLLNLPESVQRMIDQGRLSAGQARPLVSLRDRATQVRLAEKIVTNDLSSREAEDLVKGLRETGATATTRTPATLPQKSADILRFEQQVSESIGAQFTLEDGCAVINYYGDLDVLEGIVDRLGVRRT